MTRHDDQAERRDRREWRQPVPTSRDEGMALLAKRAPLNCVKLAELRDLVTLREAAVR